MNRINLFQKIFPVIDTQSFIISQIVMHSCDARAFWQFIQAIWWPINNLADSKFINFFPKVSWNFCNMLPYKSIKDISAVNQLNRYQIWITCSIGVVIQIEIMSSHINKTEMSVPKILNNRINNLDIFSNLIYFPTYTGIGFIDISWSFNSIHWSRTILEK